MAGPKKRKSGGGGKRKGGGGGGKGGGAVYGKGVSGYHPCNAVIVVAILLAGLVYLLLK